MSYLSGKSKRFAVQVTSFQGPKLTEAKDFIEKYLDGKEGKYTNHKYLKTDNRESIKFINHHDKEVTLL